MADFESKTRGRINESVWQSWSRSLGTIKRIASIACNQTLITIAVLLALPSHILLYIFHVKYLLNTREFMIHTNTQLCRPYQRFPSRLGEKKCGVMVQKV